MPPPLPGTSFTGMNTIEAVHARQILDSRGNPPSRSTCGSTGGASGRAAVPSGASTGDA
jgi:enolase